MSPLSKLLRLGKGKTPRAGTDKQALELDELSEKGRLPGDAKADDIQIAPWRALFFFTTKAHLPCLSVAIVSAIVTGIVSPASALLVGKAYQSFAGTTDGNELVHKVTKYVLYMVGVALASWLLHFIYFCAWVTFGELQANSARDRLFNGMLVKDIEWYDLRKNGVGALIPRLQVQVRELQLASSQPFGSLIATISTAFFNVGLALYYSWKLTLVIIAALPVIVVILAWLGAAMQPHVKKQQEKLTEALKHITSALAAIETVKCFNGQRIELDKYSKAIEEASAWYMRLVNSNAVQFGFTAFMSSGMFIQGFYYGGVLVRNGEKNSGDVVTTFMAALGAFGAISGILPQMIVLEKGRTAGATLRAVMTQIERGPKISAVRGSATLESCRGDINLKNVGATLVELRIKADSSAQVSFAYPTRPDQMALRGVTMFIPGGGTTFLIGKSGSGKSTLGQLLMRFYTPGLGEILLDGVPLSKLDVTWLRQHLTLVEQHSTLFENTVFNNLALGRGGNQEVSRAEVMRAIEFSLLQLMINDMPEGIDTVVGARGDTMSGGQRQRMALARAYLRDTPVLLLDESTSALDQVSRSLMMDAIREWRQGRTTIVITHDISQILPNDYAIIFEEGRLVQEGYRKHMEKLKDTPFQDFLSEEQQALISPVHTHRHFSLNLQAEADSTKPPRSPTGASANVDDPLEAQLTAGESNWASFLPTAFTNKYTTAALQGAGKFGRPISTFGPFLMKNPNTSPPSPTTDSPRGCWADPSDTHQLPAPPRKPVPDKRISKAPELMQKFLDKTGTLAAQARLQGRQRQRIRSEPLIDTTPPKRRDKLIKSLRKVGLGHKVDEQEHILSVTAILKTVWPNLDRRTRTLMVLGFICTALGAAGTPVFSFILSKLILTYQETGTKGSHDAVVYSLAILGISASNATCAYFQHILLEYAGQRWVDRIREMAVERVLDQPRDFFTREENSVSRIAEGLDRHAEEMRNLLGRFAATVVSALIMISVALVWALILNWKITLVALSVGPYVWFVTRAFGAVSAKWEGMSNDAAEHTSAIFFETFTTIKTVRALTLEKHFGDRYFKSTRTTLLIGLKRALWTGLFFGLSDVSGQLVMALIFYSGAVLVRQGAPTQRIVEVFIQLIITITNVSSLLNFIPQMSASKDMATRILRLAYLPIDSHEHLGNTRVTTTGEIVFTDLTFAYPSRPDQTILNHISLSIPAGKCTAIVGSSGSGKSTIAALLLGLYATAAEPRSVPDLAVSGRDIKSIHTPTLRSLLTVVAQTPVLFAATVAENISYGLPEDSLYNNLACIRQAAIAAGIDDFIMTLPSGYDTLVGEGGLGLSGGQAQRVNIARALVRRPSVLILDEATSALDVESAGLIRQTIHSLVEREKERMTVIIITHSRDMMAIADHIFVLDSGEVVEQGGYAELLARRGEFYNLLSGGEWQTERSSPEKNSAAVRGISGSVDWIDTVKDKPGNSF